MQGLKVFHSSKMETSPFDHVDPAAAMTPAFVQSLKFSQRQVERLQEIHSIWAVELKSLRDERDIISNSIKVWSCSQPLCHIA